MASGARNSWPSASMQAACETAWHPGAVQTGHMAHNAEICCLQGSTAPHDHSPSSTAHSPTVRAAWEPARWGNQLGVENLAHLIERSSSQSTSPRVSARAAQPDLPEQQAWLHAQLPTHCSSALSHATGQVDSAHCSDKLVLKPTLSIPGACQQLQPSAPHFKTLGSATSFGSAGSEAAGRRPHNQDGGTHCLNDAFPGASVIKAGLTASVSGTSTTRTTLQQHPQPGPASQGDDAAVLLHASSQASQGVDAALLLLQHQIDSMRAEQTRAQIGQQAAASAGAATLAALQERVAHCEAQLINTRTVGTGTPTVGNGTGTPTSTTSASNDAAGGTVDSAAQLEGLPQGSRLAADAVDDVLAGCARSSVEVSAVAGGVPATALVEARMQVLEAESGDQAQQLVACVQRLAALEARQRTVRSPVHRCQ